MELKSITIAGTKQELLFATKTLGRFETDWGWISCGSRYMVGIAKAEYDRIEKKYRELTINKKLEQDRKHAELHKEVLTEV